MHFFKNFFILLILSFSLTNQLNGQSTTDKNQLFENIAVKLLDNSQISSLISLKSNSLSGACKSVCPCAPIKFTIINFSNKRVKAAWVDYNGVESQTIYTSSNSTGSSLTIDSYSNHCFRIYLDADSSTSETLYFKAPLKNTTYYSGDLTLLKQDIYNSGWLSNPNLNVQHLEQFKKLVDYQSSTMTKIDFNLVKSTFYDESSNTDNLIQSFFDSFNSSNKFIDPLFNPLNKIDSSKFSAKRVSEYSIKLPKKFNASVHLGSSFSFKITNDIDVNLKMYWIDYSATLKG